MNFPTLNNTSTRSTNIVVATVPVDHPIGVAITPDGKRANVATGGCYVTASNGNTVHVIDTTTIPKTVLAVVTVGDNRLRWPSPRFLTLPVRTSARMAVEGFRL